MILERLTLFTGAAILASTVLVMAQTGTERLFDTASFDDIRAGTTITYAHDRSADPKIPVHTIKDGGIIVAHVAGNGEAADHTLVTLKQGGGQRTLEHMPADRGNPVFVVFLESSVSAVTYATKGSPFYIRNRIKEALAAGGEVSEGTVEVDGTEHAATHIDYRPFRQDRNAQKMGAAFENLSMRFTLSDAVPGHFVTMTTQAKVDDVVYFIEIVRFDTATEEEP